MPKLLVIDGERRSVVDLEGETISVGRDPANRVVISDSLASRRHCTFEASAAGVRFVDLDSSNGSLVNGRRSTSAELTAGDTVKIGDVVIEVLTAGSSDEREDLEATPLPDVTPLGSLPSPQAPTAALQGPRVRIVEPVGEEWVSITRSPFKIGRNEDNHLVLADPRVSGEHAVILERSGDWIVAARESGNGILVDGRRVAKVQVLSGMQIQIGDYTLELEGFPQPAHQIGAEAPPVISESEVLRFKKERLEEAPNSRQGLLTGFFIVCLGVILWSGYGFVEDLQRGRVPALDSNDLLGGSGSFEVSDDSEVVPWRPSPGSDVVSIASRISSDAPHGKRTLHVTGESGQAGIVRVEEVGIHEVTGDHGFRLTGKISNEGFDRAGLALRWYTRRAGEEVLIEESFTPLRDLTAGRFSSVAARFSPPRWGDPAAVRVAIIGIGSGKLRVDHVVLKEELESVPPDEVASLETSGSVAIRVLFDNHGVATIEKDGRLRLQAFRLALGGARARPWGQILPARIEAPVVGEDGGIRLGFELDEAGQMSAIAAFARSLGTRVQMTWQPTISVPRLLAARLPSRTERMPVQLIDGELLITAAATLAELSSAAGDVLIIGSGRDQLVLTLSHRATVAVQADPGDGLGSLLTLNFGSLENNEVLECFFSSVSDREETRIGNELTRIEATLSRHLEGEARRMVVRALEDFSWRPELIVKLEAIRDEIDLMASAFGEDLVRARSDLQSYPGSPVLRYLREKCAEAGTRFSGLEVADLAAEISASLREEEEVRTVEEESAALAAVIERGENYFSQNRDELARFYFEWIIANHPDSPQRKPIQQFLRLIEARKQ